MTCETGRSSISARVLSAALHAGEVAGVVKPASTDRYEIGGRPGRPSPACSG